MTDQSEPFDEIDLRPLGESDFAVTHGLIRSTPDVAIAGPAVRQARTAAELTTSHIAREMTRRGYTTDAANIAALEGTAAYRMRPREARLLAAILDRPLSAIEATAEPWPADQAELTSLRDDGVDALVLGDDVVVRTGAGSHLGLVRCTGDPAVLDARTYRLVTATLLNGAWSHLSGALLVTHRPPHRALAVDALDCVTRSHAPSGLLGFSRLAEPEPIADALASYDRAYSINWSDPDPLDGVLGAHEEGVSGLADRLAALADRLDDEARRARQPGKRPGYETTAAWLRSVEPQTVLAFLDELATAPPTAVHERLGEMLEVASP